MYEFLVYCYVMCARARGYKNTNMSQQIRQNTTLDLHITDSSFHFDSLKLVFSEKYFPFFSFSRQMFNSQSLADMFSKNGITMIF